MDLAQYARLTDDEIAYKLAQLNAEQRILFRWEMNWALRARPKQLPPAGPWYIWDLMSGRGFGKTLTGANWLGLEAARDPGSRNLVVAPTHDDCRNVCFEGETGLLNVIPPDLIENYNKTTLEMTLTNGAFIKGYNAIEPDRLRGPQWHRAWCEEIGSWRNDRTTWDMLVFAVRLGTNVKICVTSTPKPRPLVSMLVKQAKERPGHTILVRGSTYENRANLNPTFLEEVLKYEGTKLGRQEIYGELIDPEEAGIIKRSQFKLWPADKELPEFAFIALSLDTAFTEDTMDEESGDPDYTAATCWGVFYEEHKLSSYRGKTGRARVANAMLLDGWEDRLGFPDLVTKVKEDLKARYGKASRSLIKPVFGQPLLGGDGKGIDTVIIEDKGSGISLRQTLEADGVQAYPYNPGRADKLARLHVVSPLFARGRIWTLESRKNPGNPRAWAEPAISQCCTYAGEGSIEHDDSMDTVTQVLRVLTDFGLLKAATDEQLIKLAQKNFENSVLGLPPEPLYNGHSSEYDPPPATPQVNPYAQ